ncbi:MAG: thioredoxin family protein [Planctomycetes bacterium]|nr:thioredoxin family protein [Planctomycetota bacterium]
MRKNLVVLGAVVLAFAAVAVLRSRDRRADDGAPHPRDGLPRLIERGSDKCASCKAMEPVLDELRRDHAAALDVVFIDVWKSPERAEPFGVRVIPTQVFVAPGGAELGRHEGFFSAAQIRARFDEFGYALGVPTPARSER